MEVIDTGKHLDKKREESEESIRTRFLLEYIKYRELNHCRTLFPVSASGLIWANLGFSWIIDII